MNNAIVFCTIVFITTTCVRAPTTQWEDLEGNGEAMLNVFGLISLDPDLESFVRVYRTTNLTEVTEILVSRFAEADQNLDGAIDAAEFLAAADNDGDGEIGDDEWLPAADLEGDGLINEEEWSTLLTPRYEPAAIVEDARVVISTGGDSTVFGWDADRRSFYNRDPTFLPEPDTRYSLHITAANFGNVSGSLVTPQVPAFADELHPDTLQLQNTTDFSWRPGATGKGLLSGKVLGDDKEDDRFDPECLRVYEAVDLEEGAYTLDAQAMFCGHTKPLPYLLRLTAMDANYHEYFIIGEVNDYANVLLSSETTQGWGVGLEGGYGVFGAIASDSMLKIVTVQ